VHAALSTSHGVSKRESTAGDDDGAVLAAELLRRRVERQHLSGAGGSEQAGGDTARAGRGGVFSSKRHSVRLKQSGCGHLLKGGAGAGPQTRPTSRAPGGRSAYRTAHNGERRCSGAARAALRRRRGRGPRLAPCAAGGCAAGARGRWLPRHDRGRGSVPGHPHQEWPPSGAVPRPSVRVTPRAAVSCPGCAVGAVREPRQRGN
jgi:hypothetical protein